jgi:hypothetical protein
MSTHPVLEPRALGLPPDPSEWADGQAARFAAVVKALKLSAAPHPSMLGIPSDMWSWTYAQRALNRAAADAWLDGWEPDGDVIVSCDLEQTHDGELVPAENWGEVTPMDFRGYSPLSTYSRRPNCARRTVAKIRSRARSGLRGGRPAARRTTSRASASGDSSSGEPGEPPPARSRPTRYTYGALPSGVWS